MYTNQDFELQTQNELMGQSEEIKLNWTKTLRSIFEQLLAAINKIFFLERKLGTRLRLHPILRFYKNFQVF